MGVLFGIDCNTDLGLGWSLLSLFRHLAACRQYCDDNNYILIVFLIQNTQNRDARALHLKLDEVIRALGPAHNDMINIENLSDAELEHLTARYERFRTEWKKRAEERTTS